ncbi:MAG: hypothetical protein JSR58_05370 [Verrucomicrobia bacterium]|nr:hypothetical protein [Verrucomicrobiota bacterium]
MVSSLSSGIIIGSAVGLFSGYVADKAFKGIAGLSKNPSIQKAGVWSSRVVQGSMVGLGSSGVAAYFLGKDYVNKIQFPLQQEPLIKFITEIAKRLILHPLFVASSAIACFGLSVALRGMYAEASEKHQKTNEIFKYSLVGIAILATSVALAVYTRSGLGIGFLAGSLGYVAGSYIASEL